MVPLSKLSSCVATAVACNALLVAPAFAYVDPGTGTMLLQAAGALLAAALFYLRNIRLWIARHFGGGGKSTTTRSSTDSDDTAQN